MEDDVLEPQGIVEDSFRLTTEARLNKLEAPHPARAAADGTVPAADPNGIDAMVRTLGERVTQLETNLAENIAAVLKLGEALGARLTTAEKTIKKLSA